MRHLAVLLCAGLLGLPLQAAAHGDLHEQIQRVTAQLQKDPANAALVHERGEMHRAHGDYVAAFADYDRAEHLDPKLSVVLMSRGRALFETDHFAQALHELTRYLEREPGHPEALLLRARIAAALHDFDRAEADFRAAIAATREPTADLFLERAANLQAAGRLEVALGVLGDGLSKLPGVITLELAALDLELRVERFDAALQRMERLIASAPRKETLLARKAAVLERAGRQHAARRALEAALLAIASLPEAKRELPSTRALAQELRQALATHELSRRRSR